MCLDKAVLAQGGGGGGKALENSIAFGSAPRREPDSQPISQLVRQAVSQTVRQSVGQTGRQTETHNFVFFFSGRPGFNQWGEQKLSEQAAVEL